MANKLREKINIGTNIARTTTYPLTYFPGTEFYLNRTELFLRNCYHYLKRGVDIVLAATLLICLSPMLVFIGLLIKFDSPGFPIFSQWRKGLNGKPFHMYKFRTMINNAALRKTQIIHQNQADGILFKIRRDPRITPIGNFLRRLSLDEFPQLLNVIRGEMSLVGPRPFSLEDFSRSRDNGTKFNIWVRERHSVRPGMTGLWQVKGRNDLSFDDLIRLDLYYVRNCHFWLDLLILFQTIPAVLTKKGAY